MLEKVKNRKSIILLILVITVLAAATIANAYPRQLTRDVASDMFPETDGSNIVWLQEDRNSVPQYKIIYFDGSTETTKVISVAGLPGTGPQIDNGKAVWRGYESTSSNDPQIFLYDGSDTIKLTSGSNNKEGPQISGDNVVWQGYDGNDYEIFFYNGSSVTTLTNNAYDDINPEIDGDNIVWHGLDGTDYEIFLYNGSNVTTITNNNYSDHSPKISGNNIVWHGLNGTDWEIFFYDGSTVTTLTDNSYDDSNPEISGSNVVWHGLSGVDWEIFFYDGSTVSTITINAVSDRFPQIDGNNIVWQSSDGIDEEINLFDGNSIIKLTDDTEKEVGYPQISGNKIVWRGCDLTANPSITGGGYKIATNPTDWEIFTSNVVPQLDPISTWSSAEGGWSWGASKTTAGDFNNDGFDDVAVLYGYKTDRNVNAFVFLGNDAGGFSPAQLWWSSGPGNWDWDGSKLTSGDYDGDGADDLGILYGYQTTRQTKAWVLTSDATATNTFNSPQEWWDSGPNNWDWEGSKIISGDFDMDNGDDLAILYGYKTERDVRVFVLTSSASNSFDSPVSWFHAGPGNWDWEGSKLSSGDYNGDDAYDLSILYGYQTERDVIAFVFLSNGTSFGGAENWWQAGPGNWDWNGSSVLSGDFTGQGGDDLAIFYAYGGAQSGIFILPSDGQGFKAPKSWWNSGPGNWAGDASKVVAGDFNGGGRADIGALYDYGNSQTGMHVIR